jgi:hypothetical protein
MNGHRSDFRKFGTVTANKPDSAALYKHLKDHNQTDFRVQILDRIDKNKEGKVGQVSKLSQKLDEREKHWIWKLDTIIPRGLNIDDGFHCQNKGPRKTRTK